MEFFSLYSITVTKCTIDVEYVKKLKTRKQVVSTSAYSTLIIPGHSFFFFVSQVYYFLFFVF